MRVNPFGLVIVLFGFANLAITRWVVTRRRAGRPLPGMLRAWETIGRRPWLSVFLACAEIAVGVLVAVEVIDF